MEIFVPKAGYPRLPKAQPISISETPPISNSSYTPSLCNNHNTHSYPPIPPFVSLDQSIHCPPSRFCNDEVILFHSGSKTLSSPPHPLFQWHPKVPLWFVCFPLVLRNARVQTVDQPFRFSRSLVVFSCPYFWLSRYICHTTRRFMKNGVYRDPSFSFSLITYRIWCTSCPLSWFCSWFCKRVTSSVSLVVSRSCCGRCGVCWRLSSCIYSFPVPSTSSLSYHLLVWTIHLFMYCM